MLPEELLRKVKQIELTTRRMVDDLMSGSFKSQFKGHGVQFSEHRQYIAGDDVRHIDWKVSARTRDPMLKKYEEERELTVFLVVDISGSAAFGSKSKRKQDVAAEVAGMLAYAASQTGDKVGVLLFAGEVEKILPPRKGKQHIMRIIRELLTYVPKTKGTDLRAALESVVRVMKHRGIVFVISDFLAEDYALELRRIGTLHDVVAIQVGDTRERAVPKLGQLLVSNPETGEQTWIDTESYAFKKWMGEFVTRWDETADRAFKGGQVERLKISTEEDYGEAVVRFFRARGRRRSR